MPSLQEIPIPSKISNKVALITGAAKRIGREIALDLHQYNIDIAIHYRNSENEARKFCELLNSKRKNSAHLIQVDLTLENADELLICAVQKHFTRLDFLVNNASIFYPTPVDENYNDSMEIFFNINSSLPFKLIRRAAPLLKKNNGAIVNIVDIYAMKGLAEHTCYVASKSVLLELTKEFAHSLAPHIRVNSVSPGAILWPEFEK